MTLRNVVNEVNADRHTRLVFIALCCYLASQSYMIPLFILGPSWATWPTASDIVVGLVIVAGLVERRHLLSIMGARQRTLWGLFALIWLWVFSWLIHIGMTDYPSSAISVGGYYIYRMIQFTLIFVFMSAVPLNQGRLVALRRVTLATLVFVCIFVLLTFFSIVGPNQLGGHLPTDPYVSGPWGAYVLAQGGVGWGTIGYNHGYVALQILMLTALHLHLSAVTRANYSILFIALPVAAAFLTGSRAGLAAVLVFLLFAFRRRPLPLLIFGLAAVAMLLAQSAFSLPNDDGLLYTVTQRQGDLLLLANADNLNGRHQIWLDHISFLNENPMRWLTGAGLGATMDGTDPVGTNAHMLFLQVILDTGIIGLILFLAVFWMILQTLWEYEVRPRPLFWVTVVLLITAVTQETFYPVAAFGHFLGLFLVSMSLALNDSTVPWRPEKQEIGLRALEGVK